MKTKKLYMNELEIKFTSDEMTINKFKDENDEIEIDIPRKYNIKNSDIVSC